MWCVPRSKYTPFPIQQQQQNGPMHGNTRIHSVGIVGDFGCEGVRTYTESLFYLTTFVCHFSAARVGGRIGRTVIVR
jgi:hypothetical protein